MEGFKSITNAMAEMEGKIGKLWDIVNNPIKNILIITDSVDGMNYHS